MSYSVAKNTSFLTAASILQKVISFVYFTIVARFIGVENTGQYFFAITFTTIFTVIADFGLGPVLTREAARYPENTDKYINTIFWSKVLFGVGAYLLVFFFINVLNYPAATRYLVYMSGATMFFDNLHSAFYSVFRARKNLVYESIGVVGSQFITLAVGSVAIFLHWPLIWLIAAYTIPAGLNFLFSAYFARKVFDLHYRFSWDKNIFRLFVSFALPFALAGILSRLYSYSDSLLMSKMLTNQELGWWSVPYKITFAFQFIPVALSASVYPVMSSLYIEDKTKIAALFEKSWRYLFVIIFPLSFGLIALAEPAIIKLYRPDYYPSIAVLRILMISLVFSYLSLITGALLNATNKQKIQTSLIGLSLALSIGLNLILLPKFGILGAAAAALICNFVLFTGGFYFSSRQIPMRYSMLFKYANQSFWPALVMGAAVYILQPKMNFLLTVPIGAVIYAALLLATGAVNRPMIEQIYSKVMGKQRIEPTTTV